MGVVRFVVAVVGALPLVACTGGPRANISSPVVYTAPQLAAAEAKIPKDAHFNTSLARYFELTPGDYQKQALRMDTMLDSAQRLSAFYQQVEALTKLRLAARLADIPAENPSNAADADAADLPDYTPSTINAEKALSIAELLAQNPGNAQTLGDSPFDQLDRVTDFYTAYIIKYLRQHIPSEQVRLSTSSAPFDDVPFRTTAATPPPSGDPIKADPNQDRLLFLVFQTHIDPGQFANHKVRLNIQITGAWTDKKLDCAEDEDEKLWQRIRVIRVHPTRAYDLDATAFGESVETALDAAMRLAGPAGSSGSSIDAAAGRRAAARSEQRRQFLSRIAKHASYVDAANKTFGWNFFPSNLVVEERALVWRSLGLLIGDPSRFRTRAYLEGGGRDCGVYLVVPQTIRRLELSVSSTQGDIDRDTIPSNPAAILGNAPRLLLDLPPLSRQEIGAIDDVQQVEALTTRVNDAADAIANSQLPAGEPAAMAERRTRAEEIKLDDIAAQVQSAADFTAAKKIVEAARATAQAAAKLDREVREVETGLTHLQESLAQHLAAIEDATDQLIVAARHADSDHDPVVGAANAAILKRSQARNDVVPLAAGITPALGDAEAARTHLGAIASRFNAAEDALKARRAATKCLLKFDARPAQLTASQTGIAEVELTILRNSVATGDLFLDTNAKVHDASPEGILQRTKDGRWRISENGGIVTLHLLVASQNNVTFRIDSAEGFQTPAPITLEVTHRHPAQASRSSAAEIGSK